jgi:hypothetical protein
MLAMLRWRLRFMSDFVVQRRRASGHSYLSRHRMLEVHQVAIDAALLAGEYLLVIRNIGRQDVGVVQELQPFRSRLLRENAVECSGSSPVSNA